MKKLCLLILCVIVSANCGCGPKFLETDRICTGNATAMQAMEVLDVNSQLIKPLYGKGQCLARINNGKKVHKESFSIRLWCNPPAEIRFWGDIAFNNRGLDIGSNADEFWAAMKPNEIGNSFYWGLWAEQRDVGNLKLSPKVLLEGLGIVELRAEDDWTFSNEGAYDVLTKFVNGRVVKKIYIYNCEYRIRKIEYFDDKGKLSMAVLLNDYRDAFEDCIIPFRIKVSSFNSDDTKDTFEIKLDKASAYEFTEQRRKNLFSLNETPKGFKHIYRIVDGELIELE